jgi:hypothetical protein
MKLTNDTYLVRLRGKTWVECYYRDRQGWIKISARGRKFRLTAEQVLNHLLPALADVKPGLTVQVKHRPKRAVRHASAASPTDRTEGPSPQHRPE